MTGPETWSLPLQLHEDPFSEDQFPDLITSEQLNGVRICYVQIVR